MDGAAEAYAAMKSLQSPCLRPLMSRAGHQGATAPGQSGGSRLCILKPRQAMIAIHMVQLRTTRDPEADRQRSGRSGSMVAAVAAAVAMVALWSCLSVSAGVNAMSTRLGGPLEPGQDGHELSKAAPSSAGFRPRSGLSLSGTVVLCSRNFSDMHHVGPFWLLAGAVELDLASRRQPRILIAARPTCKC